MSRPADASSSSSFLEPNNTKIKTTRFTILATFSYDHGASPPSPLDSNIAFVPSFRGCPVFSGFELPFALASMIMSFE